MSPQDPIRLVAIDLDGTLVDDRNEVAPRVAGAIEAARAEGVEVVIATGRMFRSALKFVDELSLTAPVICYQGAQIRDPASGAVLHERLLGQRHAAAVIEFARRHRVHVNAFAGDELYMAELTAEGRFYCRLSGIEPRLVGDLGAWLDRDLVKLVLVTDSGDSRQLVGRLVEAVPREINITRSHPRLVEAIDGQVNKGDALARLSQIMDIPISQIMGIGDNLNDLPLVKAAGFGVAMGSGAPETKAAADFVTAPYEEDGVAVAIERFVLG
ncbi:MAG: Cof-type HAD-IIB family hydrolase [Chloroflexota bacterium]|nr:Cof-type HAD-IIB family hydrolase [Chloroflexota bacterium]